MSIKFCQIMFFKLPHVKCLKVELNIISNSTCHDNYVAFDIGIKGDMICVFKGPLGTETICNGDSGGPLMVSVKFIKHWQCCNLRHIHIYYKCIP